MKPLSNNRSTEDPSHVGCCFPLVSTSGYRSIFTWLTTKDSAFCFKCLHDSLNLNWHELSDSDNYHPLYVCSSAKPEPTFFFSILKWGMECGLNGLFKRILLQRNPLLYTCSFVQILYLHYSYKNILKFYFQPLFFPDKWGLVTLLIYWSSN